MSENWRQFIGAKAVIGAAKTNAASATPVTMGLSFLVEIGERIVINFTLVVQCSGVGGVVIKTAALPAGMTGRLSLEGTTTGAGVFTAVSTTTPAVSPQTWVTFAGTGIIYGVLELEASTAQGTVDLQFAPFTNAQTATIHLGSNALALRI